VNACLTDYTMVIVDDMHMRWYRVQSIVSIHSFYSTDSPAQDVRSMYSPARKTRYSIPLPAHVQEINQASIES
jgi:hypothetical protein